KAVCDGLTPLFGPEGVDELKQVLQDLSSAEDEEVQWGFLLPTEDPVSFDMLDTTAPADAGTGPEPTPTDDIDSFFAGIDASSLQDVDDIEVIELGESQDDSGHAATTEADPFDLAAGHGVAPVVHPDDSSPDPIPANSRDEAADAPEEKSPPAELHPGSAFA